MIVVPTLSVMVYTYVAFAARILVLTLKIHRWLGSRT